jgi:putative tryptophan/tyrosine transport system substrate-binding protein
VIWITARLNEVGIPTARGKGKWSAVQVARVLLFETMVQEKCDALFVLAGPIEPKIVLLAAGKKMPAIYQFSAYVDLGGLASYGASLALMGKQTAQYTAKIFQGAKPAELPVEQPVVFELALNLKTAAALGLSIPAVVIARADKVIE